MLFYALIRSFTVCQGLTLHFHQRLCRRIQQQCPLHWSELDFKPWMAPDGEREGQEIRAQGRMTH